MPSSRLVTVVSLLGFAALIDTANAQAQPIAASTCIESAESNRLFDLGIELLKLDLNRAALDALERSYGLSHCNLALAQIAFAERGLKRWKLASVHLRTVLESNEPWLAPYREQFQQQQQIIEDNLQRAGDNEEPAEPVKSTGAVAPRSKIGWWLLAGGLIFGAAGVTSMSVAQGFANAVNPYDPMCPCAAGQPIYNGAFFSGVALLGIGTVGTIAGTVILIRAKREQGHRSVAAWRLPLGNGLALGASL